MEALPERETGQVVVDGRYSVSEMDWRSYLAMAVLVSPGGQEGARGGEGEGESQRRE